MFDLDDTFSPGPTSPAPDDDGAGGLFHPFPFEDVLGPALAGPLSRICELAPRDDDDPLLLDDDDLGVDETPLAITRLRCGAARAVRSPAIHGAPTTAHGPRPTAHGPRPTAHGAPTTVHGAPTTAHGPRPTTHGAPTTVHGAPTTVHGLRPAAHGPRSAAHGPRPTARGTPTTAHGAPTTAHGAPATPHGPASRAGARSRVIAPAEDVEVAIVGGGLVGCALSIALARAGVPSTVLERTPETPELLRGELVMPAGAAVLEALGLGAALRGVALPTDGVVLRHPAFAESCPDSALHVDYADVPAPDGVPAGGWRPQGLCGWRRPLYEALRAAARSTPGVTFRSGVEVARLERLADGRHLLEGRRASAPRLRARLAIGCDGHASRVRHLLGLDPIERHAPTQVQGFVGRAAGWRATRVHVGWHPLGAAFVFPFPDGHYRSTVEVKAGRREALAGPDALATHLRILREALPDVWAALGGKGISPLTPLQVQPAPSITLAGVVDDGAALAGDAAGCLDPFTGHGMTLGLLDAADLARVVALCAGTFSARRLRPYEAARAARVAARRRSTDLLAYAFLDGDDPLAHALAARLASRWTDPRVAPAVAAGFAGFDAPAPSVGLELWGLGLL